MPITAGEATDIAKAHGLSRHDVTTLQALANSTHEAWELAAQFKHRGDRSEPTGIR